MKELQNGDECYVSDVSEENALKSVMFEAMAIYLESQVEFEMSVEGKIKELLK